MSAVLRDFRGDVLFNGRLLHRALRRGDTPTNMVRRRHSDKRNSLGDVETITDARPNDESENAARRQENR